MGGQIADGSATSHLPARSRSLWVVLAVTTFASYAIIQRCSSLGSQAPRTGSTLPCSSRKLLGLLLRLPAPSESCSTTLRASKVVMAEVGIFLY